MAELLPASKGLSGDPATSDPIFLDPLIALLPQYVKATSRTQNAALVLHVRDCDIPLAAEADL